MKLTEKELLRTLWDIESKLWRVQHHANKTCSCFQGYSSCGFVEEVNNTRKKVSDLVEELSQ